MFDKCKIKNIVISPFVNFEVAKTQINTRNKRNSVAPRKIWDPRENP